MPVVFGGRRPTTPSNASAAATTLHSRQDMSPEEFFLLPPHLQLHIVQRKLCLVQRSLDKATFQKFVQAFVLSFKGRAEKIKAGSHNRDLDDNATTKTMEKQKEEEEEQKEKKKKKTYKKKVRKEKPKQYSRDPEESGPAIADEKIKDMQAHLDAVARRLLYTQIREMEPKILAAKLSKVVAMSKQVLCYFRALVSRIIVGEDVSRFQSKDAKSHMLTNILEDLENIDLADGTNAQDCAESTKDIEEDLRCGSLGGTCRLVIGNENVLVPDVTNSYFAKSLLNDMRCTDPHLPDFDQHELEVAFAWLEETGNVFEETTTSGAAESLAEPYYRSAAGAIYRQTHGTEPCCVLESPCCVLTDLLIAEKLNQVKAVNVPCTQKPQLASLLK